MKGSAGSGKSVDTAQQYILRLMADRGRNLVCVRKADVTNRDSTYAELTSAIFKNGLTSYWDAKLSPLTLTCRANGNQIIFRGMNDDNQREKIKSITFAKGKLTDIWIEEATELTQQDFDILDDRLRGELDPNLFYQIKATFNPVSKTHWIKRVFFDYQDKNTLTNHSTYLDNRFIDAAYKERMMRRKELDPDGYSIYGLGDWGEIGGLILTNYKILSDSEMPKEFDYIVNAQDFGFNHANAIGEVGFLDGNLYLLREIYEYGKDANQLIEQAGKQGFRKDLKMWCDSARPDDIQIWRNAGWNARGVDKGGSVGSVQGQINILKGMTIHIHHSCVNTIKEIQQWKYQRDKTTGDYTDQPVNFFDDAMAMLRYSIEDIRHNKTVTVFTPSIRSL